MTKEIDDVLDDAHHISKVNLDRLTAAQIVGLDELTKPTVSCAAQALKLMEVIVITHINSHGVCSFQCVLGDESQVDDFMAKNFKDFWRNVGEDVWVCGYDHVITKKLKIQ